MTQLVSPIDISNAVTFVVRVVEEVLEVEAGVSGIKE